MINKIINEGGIVPAKITVGLIAAAMKESGSKKFLVDGFPRNVENLLVWYELMSDQCIVDSVLNLDLDEDTMKARLLERGKTSGRSDDNEATITKRFRTFNVDTKPVLDLYSFAGKLRTVRL
jgi:UMP-CMP kinase